MGPAIAHRLSAWDVLKRGNKQTKRKGKIMNKVYRMFIALALCAMGLVSQAQAAITWNFASATGELEGLGTAIVTAGGLAIAAGLVVYGLWKGVGFVLKIFSRVSSK
jgi:hypothetical protein